MSEIDMPYKTIVEMLERIRNLEERVAELEKVAFSPTFPKNNSLSVENISQTVNKSNFHQRDKTHYLFEDKEYLKNKLVLAVVKSYVDSHKETTVQQLKQVFDKSLQGSIGVVVECNEAQRRYDYRTRFFAEADEVIHLADGDVYVCNQWGVVNLPNFLEKAEQLGFDIKPIRR